MKHPRHLSLFLAILLTALTGMAQPADTSMAGQLRALQLQMDILQGHQGNLDMRYENKSDALDNQVEGLRNIVDSGKWDFWGGLVGIIIAIAGGYAAIYFKLLATAKSMIEQKLIKLLEERKDDLSALLNRNARLKAYRKSKQLVVICLDDGRAAAMKELLHGQMGFEHVRLEVGNTLKPILGAHLAIIDHVGFDEGNPQKQLPMSLVEQYIQSEDRPMMLYFGAQNRELSKYSPQLAFANSHFTLFTRMLEVFDYQAGIDDAVDKLK